MVVGGKRESLRKPLFRVLDGLRKTHKNIFIITDGEKGERSFATEWATSRHVRFKPYEVTNILEKIQLGTHANSITIPRFLKKHRPHILVAYSGGKKVQQTVKFAHDKHIEVIQVSTKNSPKRQNGVKDVSTVAQAET